MRQLAYTAGSWVGNMAKRKTEQPVVIVSRPDAAPVNVPAEPIKIDVTFDAWWSVAQGSLRLKPEMKEVLKHHFIARGFMASKEFDKGLKDFGLVA